MPLQSSAHLLSPALAARTESGQELALCVMCAVCADGAGGQMDGESLFNTFSTK